MKSFFGVVDIKASLANLDSLGFVDQDSDEWVSMWHDLSSIPCNKRLSDPATAADENGEVWQYMGSFEAPLNKIRKTGVEWVWVHEFRHRNHPTIGRRTVHLRASKNFCIEGGDK
jgi:beta-xylosidase